jgi:AhpD family alkylhydroperoxidase
MTGMFTTTSILIAFVIYLLGRYFLIPLLREWPGDMPETKRLRRLQSADEFMRYLRMVVKAMLSLRNLPKQDRLQAQLSEKLMLAVSGVNECARCSYLHTQTALEKGISKNEIRDLLAGRLEGMADEDLPALLFAQHYAESRGEVSAEAREAMVKAYGENKACHMSAYLLTVLFGNLCCNTVHYYTRGRLDEKQRMQLYLAYLLARPVEWFITRNAAQHALKRSMMEGN